MKSWLVAGITLFVAATAMPQDLPPEVVVLARIKQHISEEMARLPNYTCLQTMNRFTGSPTQREMKQLDTVRLEVIYSDHKEWFGSPGARNLNVNNPAAFVGDGLIGFGQFAIGLHNVLGGAHFDYHGKEVYAGRAAIRYDFQFPRQPGAFEVTVKGGSGSVGEKGSMWVDEESLDLIRMELNADNIPSYIPLAEQKTSVDYARMRIGDSEALMPQQSDVWLMTSDGLTDYNHLEFTHCRAYSAESVISFNVEPANAIPETKPEAAAPAADITLPADLRVTVRLTTPVSNKDAVGKLIEGKVVGDVVHKGKIVVHDGALVGGRIRRLERDQGKISNRGSRFIVGLEFTDIEAGAGRAPFYADLLTLDKMPGIRTWVSEHQISRTTSVTLRELPGVASFFMDGDHFELPAGFKMVWRTRGPIRGIDQ